MKYGKSITHEINRDQSRSLEIIRDHIVIPYSFNFN